MKQLMICALAAMTIFTAKAQSQVEEPLRLMQTISLPGLQDGDFDHFLVDLPGMRLFLAAEDNSAVEVIDLRTNELIHTIRGPKAPHSMAYDDQARKLFVVDDGGPSQVEMYDGTTYKFLGAIPMQAHADSSIYDSANHFFYVANGGRDANEDYCLLSIIDTRSGTNVGQIKLDADQVEAMAIEKSGPLLYVNLTSKNAVAVVNRTERTVIATWSIADEGHGNSPMAIDEAQHRLFVVSRDPDRAIVFNTDSGKIVNVFSCVGQFTTDDAVFDPRLKRLYVVGTPFIEIFQQHGSADKYQILGQIPTAFHAITATLIPSLGRYYVAVNHHGAADAEVQVYQVIQ